MPVLKSDSPFLSFIKNHKGLWKILLLLLAGILFLWFARGTEGGTPTADTAPAGDACRTMTEEATALCSSVEGVGRCAVLLTFSRGEVTEYQGSRVVSVTPPQVSAVTVVCEGGDLPEVRATLISMLSSLYGIGTNRVSVVRMG